METCIDQEWATVGSPASESSVEEWPMTGKAKEDAKHTWVPIATLVLVALGVGGGTAWTLHNEIASVNKSITAVDEHIARVETAVRIVGAKQGGNTQTLIDEALKVAVANAKTDPDGAKTVLAIANRWITQQGESHIPAPQESFVAALAQYQALSAFPALSGTAHDGMLKLAEYSTAVEASPPPATMTMDASLDIIHGRYYLHDGVIIGPRAIVTSSDNRGTDIDNFVITNVVFKDAVIIYRSGPLVLQNVRFINCRFVVPNSLPGNQLLAAAIQQPSNATIG
jgi:hypothetical protein